MNPVSRTAYYCCGVRMQDAESANPLIGDNYAKGLMGEEGIAYWQDFKAMKAPNASNTVRHYLVDNWVKKELARRHNSTVILIGAGLDSRAFRLQPGNWVEVDEPAIIDYKNALLPEDTCPNKLERIPISFATEKLADKLAPYSGQENIIIIIEGVLMYLNAAAKDELVNTLIRLFPKHLLFCDLMKKSFNEKFGAPIGKRLNKHGSFFTDLREVPAQMFLSHGYKQVEVISTMQTAIELGLFRVPKFLVNFFLRKHFMGYAVYSFTFGM